MDTELVLTQYIHTCKWSIKLFTDANPTYSYTYYMNKKIYEVSLLIVRWGREEKNQSCLPAISNSFERYRKCVVTEAIQ
jgi:hypothetical protein